jgi:hypothetical protein
MGALTAARTKDVTWQYPLQTDDVITLEGSTDRATWFPLVGGRLGAALVGVVTSTDSAGNLGGGVLWHHTSSTTTRVTFAAKANMANDDAPTTDWQSDAYFRIRKAKASTPVGFGLAGTDGSAGLYKPGSAPGTLTSTPIAAGYVGEFPSGMTAAAGTGGNIYRVNSSTVVGTSDTTLMTLTLNKGIYLLGFNSTISKALDASTPEGNLNLRMGGTAIGAGCNYHFDNLSGGYVSVSKCIPAIITSDSTAITVGGNQTVAAARVTVTDLWAIRIA